MGHQSIIILTDANLNEKVTDPKIYQKLKHLQQYYILCYVVIINSNDYQGSIYT